MERWQSGLMQRSWKPSRVRALSEFDSLPLRQSEKSPEVPGFFVGGAAQTSRACFRGAELSIRPRLVRRLSTAYRRDIIGFADKNDIKGHFCLATLSANTGFTQVK